MNILALGIHPDDIELWCGGTVALAVRAGHHVVLADLSDGASSSNGTPQGRAAEAAKAAAILGVADRVNLGLPDTGIQSENPGQIERVVGCIRDTRPELALVPSSNDPHPDHASGGVLIQRAIFLAGVHGYMPTPSAWRVGNVLVYPSRNEVEPDFIVDISSTYETKMKAIEAHESQFVAGDGRKPTALNSPEFLPFIEARCRLHGKKIRARFGEPFQSPDPVALSDLALFES